MMPFKRLTIVLWLAVGLAATTGAGCLFGDDDAASGDDDDDDDDDMIPPPMNMSPEPEPPVLPPMVNDPSDVEGFAGSELCDDALPSGPVGSPLRVWSNGEVEAYFVPCNRSLLVLLPGGLVFSSRARAMGASEGFPGLPGGFVYPEAVLLGETSMLENGAEQFTARLGLSRYDFTRAAEDERWKPRPGMTAALVEEERDGKRYFAMTLLGTAAIEFEPVGDSYRAVRATDTQGLVSSLEASGAVSRYVDPWHAEATIEWDMTSTRPRILAIQGRAGPEGAPGPRVQLGYDGDELASITLPGDRTFEVGVSASGELYVVPPDGLGLTLRAYIDDQGRLEALGDDFFLQAYSQVLEVRPTNDDDFAIVSIDGDQAEATYRYRFATTDNGRFRYLRELTVGPDSPGAEVTRFSVLEANGCIRDVTSVASRSITTYSPHLCPLPGSKMTIETRIGDGMTVSRDVEFGADWLVTHIEGAGHEEAFEYYGLADDGMTRTEAPLAWAYGKIRSVSVLLEANAPGLTEVTRVAYREEEREGSPRDWRIADIDDMMDPIGGMVQRADPYGDFAIESDVDGLVVARMTDAEGFIVGGVASLASDQVGTSEVMAFDDFRRETDVQVHLGDMTERDRYSYTSESFLAMHEATTTHDGAEHRRVWLAEDFNALGLPAEVQETFGTELQRQRSISRDVAVGYETDGNIRYFHGLGGIDVAAGSEEQYYDDPYTLRLGGGT